MEPTENEFAVLEIEKELHKHAEESMKIAANIILSRGWGNGINELKTPRYERMLGGLKAFVEAYLEPK